MIDLHKTNTPRTVMGNSDNTVVFRAVRDPVFSMHTIVGGTASDDDMLWDDEADDEQERAASV